MAIESEVLGSCVEEIDVSVELKNVGGWLRYGWIYLGFIFPGGSREVAGCAPNDKLNAEIQWPPGSSREAPGATGQL